MATRPSAYPVFASQDTTLTATGQANKKQPKTSLQQVGWSAEQPSCEEFNWQMNNIDLWIEWLDSQVYSATPNATASTVMSRDSSANTQVNQLTSTVTTGTAPLVISSTTKVINLNADLLDGLTTSSTNTASTVVTRDGSGNFAAGTITAALVGNSSTTTALQNPRTINGTGFDGTSDIITNSWGWARTLAFNGDCTGSGLVDGSGNVAFSMTGVQAAKWTNARNLAFTGFATGNGNVDGSGNVSIALSMGSGFTTSKATNGYTYLPNGVILQWGYTNGDATFPITFPNACLNASLTSNNTSTSGYDYKIAASNLTTTGFSVTRDSDDAGTYVYWFAIGF